MMTSEEQVNDTIGVAEWAVEESDLLTYDWLGLFTVAASNLRKPGRRDSRCVECGSDK